MFLLHVSTSTREVYTKAYNYSKFCPWCECVELKYSIVNYNYYKPINNILPAPVAARSAAGRLLRLWVRIPPGAWMSLCCECCVLSGRGLCDELFTSPEESYRLWCVIVCDLVTTRMRRTWPTGGCRAKNKQTIFYLPLPTNVLVKFCHLHSLAISVIHHGVNKHRDIPSEWRKRNKWQRIVVNRFPVCWCCVVRDY